MRQHWIHLLFLLLFIAISPVHATQNPALQPEVPQASPSMEEVGEAPKRSGSFLSRWMHKRMLKKAQKQGEKMYEFDQLGLIGILVNALGILIFSSGMIFFLAAICYAAGITLGIFSLIRMGIRRRKYGIKSKTFFLSIISIATGGIAFIGSLFLFWLYLVF